MPLIFQKNTMNALVVNRILARKHQYLFIVIEKSLIIVSNRFSKYFNYLLQKQVYLFLKPTSSSSVYFTWIKRLSGAGYICCKWISKVVRGEYLALLNKCSRHRPWDRQR